MLLTKEELEKLTPAAVQIKKTDSENITSATQLKSKLEFALCQIYGIHTGKDVKAGFEAICTVLEIGGKYFADAMSLLNTTTFQDGETMAIIIATYKAITEENEDPKTNFRLAICHWKCLNPKGNANPADHEYFKKAAAQKYPPALYLRGSIYLDQSKGLNVLQNPDSNLNYKDMALDCFTQASNQGYAPAQFQLALFDNAQTQKDIFDLLTRASKHGYAPAQCQLAVTHVRHKAVANEGIGDAEIALYWFNQSAQQEDRAALHHLGLFYLNGIGGLQTDVNTALHWFTQAAAQKYPPAQFLLALSYLSLNGIPPIMTGNQEDNQKTGIDLIAKAAKGGYGVAFKTLAYFHLHGIMGHTQNLALATTLFRKAAEMEAKKNNTAETQIETQVSALREQALSMPNLQLFITEITKHIITQPVQPASNNNNNNNSGNNPKDLRPKQLLIFEPSLALAEKGDLNAQVLVSEAYMKGTPSFPKSIANAIKYAVEAYQNSDITQVLQQKLKMRLIELSKLIAQEFEEQDQEIEKLKEKLFSEPWNLKNSNILDKQALNSDDVSTIRMKGESAEDAVIAIQLVGLAFEKAEGNTHEKSKSFQIIINRYQSMHQESQRKHRLIKELKDGLVNPRQPANDNNNNNRNNNNNAAIRSIPLDGSILIGLNPDHVNNQEIKVKVEAASILTAFQSLAGNNNNNNNHNNNSRKDCKRKDHQSDDDDDEGHFDRLKKKSKK